MKSQKMQTLCNKIPVNQSEVTDPKKIYIVNSYIQMSEADKENGTPFLFHLEEGQVGIKLNGYAIIPVEEYEQLSGRKIFNHNLI